MQLNASSLALRRRPTSGCLIAVVLAGVGVAVATDFSVGWIALTGVIAASFAGAYVLARRKYNSEIASLVERYGQDEAACIVAGVVWQGETTEQLRESLRRPADVDSKVMKSKTKDTWKYIQTGRGRFALRIIVENGVVVGWDDKR